MSGDGHQIWKWRPVNWCWGPIGPRGSATEMGTFGVTCGLSYPGKVGACQSDGFQCRFQQGQALALLAQICSSALGQAVLPKPALSDQSRLLKLTEPESVR